MHIFRESCTNLPMLSWRRGACLLALAALCVLPAAAQGEIDPKSRWWTNPAVVERLGLSDQQVEEIDRMVFEAGQRAIDLKAEKQKAQLRLMRLLESDRADKGELLDALDRLEQADCAMSSIERRSRVEIAMLLSAEQRRMLRDRFDRHNRRRNLMHERSRRERR